MPSNKQYIDASNAVYQHWDTPPAGLSTMLDPGNQQPLISQVAPGLYAQAFLTDTNQVIIAYEGTASNNPGSLTSSDASILTGLFSVSANSAGLNFKTVVEDVASQYYGIGSEDVFVTGHSLGAEIASYVASVSPDIGGGTVFGSPGVPGLTNPPSSNSNFQTYVNYGDPVASYAADMAYGKSLGVTANHYGDVIEQGNQQDQNSLLESLSGFNAGSVPLSPNGSQFLISIGEASLGIDTLHPLNVYASNLGIGLSAQPVEYLSSLQSDDFNGSLSPEIAAQLPSFNVGFGSRTNRHSGFPIGLIADS